MKKKHQNNTQKIDMLSITGIEQIQIIPDIKSLMNKSINHKVA